MITILFKKKSKYSCIELVKTTSINETSALPVVAINQENSPAVTTVCENIEEKNDREDKELLKIFMEVEEDLKAKSHSSFLLSEAEVFTDSPYSRFIKKMFEAKNNEALQSVVKEYSANVFELFVSKRLGEENTLFGLAYAMIMLSLSDGKDTTSVAFELLQSMNAVQTLYAPHQLSKSVWQILLKNKVLTDREKLFARNFCTIFIDDLKQYSSIRKTFDNILHKAQKEEENQKNLCKKISKLCEEKPTTELLSIRNSLIREEELNKIQETTEEGGFLKKYMKNPKTAFREYPINSKIRTYGAKVYLDNPDLLFFQKPPESHRHGQLPTEYQIILDTIAESDEKCKIM